MTFTAQVIGSKCVRSELSYDLLTWKVTEIGDYTVKINNLKILIIIWKSSNCEIWKYILK